MRVSDRWFCGSAARRQLHLGLQELLDTGDRLLIAPLFDGDPLDAGKALAPFVVGGAGEAQQHDLLPCGRSCCQAQSLTLRPTALNPLALLALTARRRCIRLWTELGPPSTALCQSRRFRRRPTASGVPSAVIPGQLRDREPPSAGKASSQGWGRCVNRGPAPPTGALRAFDSNRARQLRSHPHGSILDSGNTITQSRGSHKSGEP